MNTMQVKRQDFNSTSAAIEEIFEYLRSAISENHRIDQIERRLFDLFLAAGRASLEDIIIAAGDGDQGQQIESDDGQKLKRSADKRSRTYRSIFGSLKITRFVYSVGEKTKALVKPVDQRLGLPSDETSYVLEDWLSNLNVDLPFEAVSQWLKKVFKIDVSSKTGHRRIAKLGQYAEDFNEQRDPVSAHQEAAILVAQVDGKGLPIRSSFESRVEQDLGIKACKRPEHKNNYPKSSRRYQPGDKTKQRVMAGAFYSITPNPRTAAGVLSGEASKESPVNKRLWAELNLIVDDEISRGSVRVFESLLEERKQRDPEGTKPLICLMDGDRHLWKLQATYLPEAVGILDLYHVMEKLWLAAHCFYRDASIDAEHWVQRQLKLLLENKVDSVRGLIQRALNQKGLSKTKREQLKSVHRYFTEHRLRMQYGEYLKAGYPIGSGVIEGACKHIVGDRMCCTGMSWEYEGAQPMLDMRVTKLNAEWGSFINFRIETEQKQLYSQVA